MKLKRFGIAPFIGFIILVILISFISAGTARGAGYSTLNVIKAGTGTGKIGSSPLGIDCGIHCSYEYANTAVVTLTAEADSGFNFQGWTGCGKVDGAACEVTMTWDTTITATFDHNITLDVTKTGTGTGVVTSDPGGISCGAVCSDVYWPGTVVTLTASADAGSTIAGWTGCGTAVANACVITPTANATVTAAFARDGTVAITKTGTGTGTVTSAPPGINCGATCSCLFPGGTSLTVIATADANSAFQTWTGCNSTSGVNCLISVSGDITPTAQFVPKAALTAINTGNGTGTVTFSPIVTDTCGTVYDCYKYNPGAVVKLTASPADYNVFQGWTGCPSSSGNTCTITMTQDVTVSAQFTTGNKLTVTKPGASGTTVYSNPAGISCASGCTEATGTFLVGQDVTVHAASTNRSIEFAYWTGDCEGTRPCKVTVDRDLSVGAVFASTTAPKYTLAITKTKKSAGDGVIESHDQSINCGPTCRNGYHMGTPITLTATANLLSTFMGWAPASLNCPATDPCTVTMGPGKTVRAIFTGPQRLIVRKQHVRAGNGTIKSDPAGINFGLYGTYAEAYYLLNTEVTLTATADTGALFTGWKPASLNCPGIDPCVVTMDKAHAVTAVFTKPKGVGKPFFAEDDE